MLQSTKSSAKLLKLTLTRKGIMLAKLIKYNLKPIIKSMLPFVTLLYFSVILFTVTAYIPEDIYAIQDGHRVIVDTILPSELQQFIHSLANFLISCSLILLFAVTIKAIIQRFKTSFYSDEAYLTHTLPIPRRTLWNAQTCTIIIVFASLITTLIPSCFILALTLNGQQLLESFGLISGCSHCIGDYFYIEPLSFITYLSYIFLVFTELSFLTLCGMLSIILKNRFHKSSALLIGIGVYFLGSCLLICIFYLISNFDPDISQLLKGLSIATPGYTPDMSFMARALGYIGTVYLGYCTILYFTNQKLLKHGINLD